MLACLDVVQLLDFDVLTGSAFSSPLAVAFSVTATLSADPEDTRRGVPEIRRLFRVSFGENIIVLQKSGRGNENTRWDPHDSAEGRKKVRYVGDEWRLNSFVHFDVDGCRSLMIVVKKVILKNGSKK
jgi:hypothetical protein|tara:strand:+ start:44 stop:424 length:381 start_codon:yes stop_codon:yes gene_type:complete